MSRKRLSLQTWTLFHSHRPLSNPTGSLLLRHSSTTTSSTAQPNARLTRLLSRLPPFARPYLSPLLHAPTTHITSFLILHELTAVIPLLGLSAIFHYANWLPAAWTEAAYLNEGVAKFGKWFARKGWFGFTTVTQEGEGGHQGELREDAFIRKTGENGRDGETELDRDLLEQEVEQKWHVSAEGRKVLIEVATAYAITKFLLPVRIMVSVWGTPWFARSVLGRVSKIFGRKKGVTDVTVGSKKV